MGVFFEVKSVFIMITSPKPSITVLNQIIQVHDEIDGVILRFDAAEKDIIHFINQLITRIPKDKIIVHNNPNILFACHLTRIHFKESNSEIDAFRNNHPEIQVSQSVHSLASAKHAESLDLSFVLFGHVFPTPSKPDLPPRAAAQIDAVTHIDISVVALGGISIDTIRQLNTNFSGFAGIRLFTNKQDFLAVKKEWLLRTTSL